MKPAGHALAGYLHKNGREHPERSVVQGSSGVVMREWLKRHWIIAVIVTVALELQALDWYAGPGAMLMGLVVVALGVAIGLVMADLE